MDEKTGVQECWKDLAPGVGRNVGDISNREDGSFPHHPSSLSISTYMSTLFQTYLRSFGSKPRRTNIPPIPAGPELRYLYISSHTLIGLTCMYTKPQSRHSTRPACTLHFPIHVPGLDRLKLQSREISWLMGRCRIAEQCSIGPKASILLRSIHQLCPG